MPIGGESVGAAYVRILADGTGLDQSVADAFDDVNGERAGEKTGEDYGKGVKKGLRKSKTSDEVEALFRLDKQRIDKLTKEMEGTFYRNIELQVRKRSAGNKDLGDRIMRDIGQGLLTRQGSVTEQFGDNLENLFERLPAIEKRALDQMGREWKRTLDEAYTMNRKFDEERVRSINNRQRQEEMLAKAQDRANRENIQRLEDSVTRAVKAFERVSRGEKKTGESLRKSVRRTTEHVRELRLEVERVPDLGGKNKANIVGTIEEMERGLGRISPRFRELNGNLDRTAPRIGRMFGKGSRNDAVNFFGSAIEGTTRLAFQLPKLAEKFSGLFSAFRAAGGGLNGIKALFAGGSGALRGFATSLASAAVAIPIVVVVLGTLVSVASLLIGTLSALASTIAFALVGALGVLATAVLPVAAGIGVLVTAIASMSDAQKKMVKEAIQPFVSGMKEIGRAAADALFGGEQFKKTIADMTKAVTSSNMKGLVVDIADAIGDVGSSWAKSLNSPGFQKWLKTMTGFIPDAIRSLGESFKNTLGGLGGIFAGAIPVTERFLGWLEKITKEFSEWANSMEGRKEIERFFERAADSAIALGGFLKQIGGLLVDIFDAGKGTGDSLFDSMAKAIERFRAYIADGGLEQWFKDTKKFAEDLGDAIVKVGQFLDALDSPGFRSFASLVIRIFGDLFEIIGRIVTPIADVVDAFDRLFKGDFSGFGSKIKDAFYSIGETAKSFLGLGIVDQIIGLFTGLGPKIGEAMSGVGSAVGGALKSSLDSVTRFFKSALATVLDLVGNVGGILGKLPGVPDNLGASAKRAADKLRGLGNDADKAKGQVERLGNQRPNPRASDGGTFSKMKTLADNVRNAIEKIPKNPRTSVKGSISPPNWLNTLSNLGSKLASLAGTVVANVRANIPKTAVGGMFSGAQARIIAEDGPEAVVPLRRNLSQVDPAVRELSAFAQGLKSPGGGGNSRSVTVGDVTVVTPSKDPKAVARELLDEIVGKLL